MTGRFRVMVTGSRTWVWPDVIEDALTELFAVFAGELTVVHGDCPAGADRIADWWCFRRGVPVERYPADWSMGRAAGYFRNAQMVESRPDRCLAFIHKRSRGASHCADLAEHSGIPTVRYERSTEV
jgi:hypothetical protein